MNVKVEPQCPMTEEALCADTGKGWEEWFVILDAFDAATKGRRISSQHLAEVYTLSLWHSVTVAVEYEASRGILERDKRPKGYVICASKTIAAPIDRVFAAWLYSAALSQWFGKNSVADARAEGAYSNADGDCGVYKRIRENRDIRLTWENPAHAPASVADITFDSKSAGKTVVLVAHDRIPSRALADGLREGWGEALSLLKAHLEAEPSSL